MNGIDISSWQQGIDLNAVPFDFCLAKATQGVTYTSPDFAHTMKQGLKLGRCMGAYHYASGGTPEAEAMYFLRAVEPYLGQLVLALDWEATQNPIYGTADEATWVRKFLDFVASNSPATPMLYISASLRSRLAGILKLYPGWIAQYPDEADVRGYIDKPWNEGAYECAIRQYTSHGYLPGWSGRLDLNKAYITAEDWAQLADRAAVPAAPEPDKVVNITAMAREVIDAQWGNGAERRERLGEWFYCQVQAEVNRLMGEV